VGNLRNSRNFALESNPKHANFDSHWTGGTLPRVLSEILEHRIFLSAQTVHLLDSAPDPRFFLPVHSIPAHANVPVTAPAKSFSPFKLNLGALEAELRRAPKEFTALAKNPLVLRLPTPDGTLERFNIVDAPVMEDALAAKYPQIQTFRGVGIDDPTASVRLDYTPLGFHAQVIAPSGWYDIDPYYRNDASGTYVSYFRRDLPTPAGTRADDLVEDDARGVASGLSASQASVSASVSPSLVTGGTLRTFRAAVAADGEYVAAVGGGTVTGGLSAVTTAINRVTGVYETEIDCRLVLVSNESSIIYTNASTDPYSNSNASKLLSQNQTNLDKVIGDANYDIGHVFSTAGGGLAYLGVVGETSWKARGETGLSNPTGDAFYIDYVAHEMGHQFGANHTFNTASDTSNRNASTAYEPGSGSTIMAYAGIEGTEDLQPHSDPYFHAISLQEISNYLSSIPGVGTSASTGNAAPSVSAGSNYTIPTGTPFALTASGSDPNGDQITYDWQEMDLGAATLLTTPDNGASPLFRDWVPSTSPTRTVPQLAGILNGTDQTLNGSSEPVEKLYAMARTSHWRVIARDNDLGGGGVATSDMTLTVVNTGAAFAVTNLDSPTTWNGNSTQTITWNVAGTTGNGMNVANVKISISTDGGKTFSTLLASTPNDGSQAITVPNTATTQARIKIEAVGNIFFDINNANLTIQGASATPNTPALAAGMDTGTSSSDNITKRNNAPGNALQFTIGGTVSGATVTLYSNGNVIGSAVASGTTTTITPTSTILDGTYNITAKQTESGKQQSVVSGALVVTIDTVAPTISSPTTFAFDALPQQIIYSFSENVQPSLATGDVSITNNTTPGATLPSSALVYTAATNTAALQFASVLPDGEYTATLAAANVTDLAGNSLASGDTLNFFFLAADGTRDERVTLTDFNVLAGNFGKTGETFSQGNYDYSADGKITLTDFNVLASQFGKSLPGATTQSFAIGASESSSQPLLQSNTNLLSDAGLL
jgi:hypothetical protein